jgi:hypothetical protein
MKKEYIFPCLNVRGVKDEFCASVTDNIDTNFSNITEDPDDEIID